MDGRIDTTDGRSLRTRLIDARDLDDVETRAGFRLAEVWGRYDFAMGRRRQAASPSYEAGRGRDAANESDAESRRSIRARRTRIGSTSAPRSTFQRAASTSNPFNEGTRGCSQAR